MPSCMSNPCHNIALLRFTPTESLHTLSDITLNTGTFPVLGSTGQPLLHRVGMERLHGLFPVFFITDDLFPQSSVPHRLLALAQP